MKMLFPIHDSETEAIVQISQPLCICMHVARALQDDVRLRRNAATLAQAGCQVLVVDVQADKPSSLEENSTEIQPYMLQHIALRPNFQQRRFADGYGINALNCFLIATSILLKQAADIYHACEWTALPACFVAALIRRKPLIFEAYELPLEDRPSHALTRGRRFFYIWMRAFLRYVLPRCAAVITVSPPIARELQRKYHMSNVVLIRNIPLYKDKDKDKGSKMSTSERLRIHLDLPAQTRIALYQGNLQPDRGLERLVRAAAYLDPGQVIVLLGQNIGTTRAELEQLIQLQGVQDRVKIISAVPYETLQDWTASANIGLTIIPLDYTRNMKMALPNKLFEYIHAGLPVLSSPLEAVGEILTTYDLGQVVRSMDPADIGTAINAMLNDPPELERISQHARQIARTELCWQKESQQLLQLYQYIAEQSKQLYLQMGVRRF
ncbi:glycosyltransferase family 4 protein [Dictyobacter arantiisoli]|uniref:Uncharacterized protein n=1 Tax=Dictyobacter arantiisoli TaxID=2014874 RepID=A0A5A5T6D7_9CHLR|nr:glycosyltransferase family 4 protein [Dictyobacter arantiisoli]GCF06928.1 hypothetical protein KDI_04920 [Dictyobacter arantiisoli]